MLNLVGFERQRTTIPGGMIRDVNKIQTNPRFHQAARFVLRENWTLGRTAPSVIDYALTDARVE